MHTTCKNFGATSTLVPSPLYFRGSCPLDHRDRHPCTEATGWLLWPKQQFQNNQKTSSNAPPPVTCDQACALHFSKEIAQRRTIESWYISLTIAAAMSTFWFSVDGAWRRSFVRQRNRLHLTSAFIDINRRHMTIIRSRRHYPTLSNRVWQFFSATSLRNFNDHRTYSVSRKNVGHFYLSKKVDRFS